MHDVLAFLTLGFVGGFGLGLIVGKFFTSLLWRAKGDHEYMNTMASGGKLYTVKRGI